MLAFAILSSATVTFPFYMEKNFLLGLHLGICPFPCFNCVNLSDVFEEIFDSFLIYVKYLVWCLVVLIVLAISDRDGVSMLLQC